MPAPQDNQSLLAEVKQVMLAAYPAAQHLKWLAWAEQMFRRQGDLEVLRGIRLYRADLLSTMLPANDWTPPQPPIRPSDEPSD